MDLFRKFGAQAEGSNSVPASSLVQHKDDAEKTSGTAEKCENPTTDHTGFQQLLADWASTRLG